MFFGQAMRVRAGTGGAEDRWSGPGLKVAGAGLNHRTRLETIRRQFRERNLVEVVEGGKAMFARWPDVDMRAANVAVLEQRKPVEYRGLGSIPRSLKTPIS
jgi:hypothetical protein